MNQCSQQADTLVIAIGLTPVYAFAQIRIVADGDKDERPQN
jgi:hypothetical protein